MVTKTTAQEAGAHKKPIRSVPFLSNLCSEAGSQDQFWPRGGEQKWSLPVLGGGGSGLVPLPHLPAGGAAVTWGPLLCPPPLSLQRSFKMCSALLPSSLS